MTGTSHPAYIDMLAAGAIAVLLEGGCSQQRPAGDNFDFVYNSPSPQQVSSITANANKSCLDDNPNPSEYCL